MAPSRSAQNLKNFFFPKLSFKKTNYYKIVIVAGDNMNIFLNENWKDLLKEFGPAIGDAFNSIMKNTLGSVSDLVPYEFIFPTS